ncbi:DNA repair protein endonuclease SAE2/CtIP C-terminus-domain-containing protein [Aspergillus unguis]
MEALNRLHRSVAESFENCFDTAYQDAITEIAAYDSRVKDAEERAKTAEEACQKTETEVNILKHKLFLLQEERRHEEVRDKENERAAERALQLDEKYDPRHVLGAKDSSDIDAIRLKRISDRYIELYEQACIVIQASGALRGQVKRHRGKVTFLRAQLEHQGPVSVPIDKGIRPRQQIDHIDPTTEPSLPLGSSHSTESLLKDPGQGSETDLVATEAATPTSKMIREPSGSNTKTGLEGASEKVVEEERPELTSTPSDDSTNELPPITPANTQGQTLKRKHIAPEHSLPKVRSSSADLANGGPVHPVMIKSETLSSSPLRYSSPRLGPTATQDLDDVGETVVTPTKRIRFYRDQNFSASPDNPPTTIESLTGQHVAPSNHKPIRIREQARALQPIDGNLRTSRALSQTPDRRRKIGAISKISSITEDGDENRPRDFVGRTSIDTPQGNQSVRDLSSENRLSGLLEGRSSGTGMLHRRAIDASTPTHNRMSPTSVLGNVVTTCNKSHSVRNTPPETPDLTRGSPDSRLRARHAAKFPRQLEEMGQTRAVPDDEPYRARPLQRLGLEHFRINPNYNNGLDYAYDEVIRRKDERKCASGCKRPGCCGDKFRAMARFGIPVDASGKTMSDDAILEKYLGKDKAEIGTLSSKDRENLLVEAKAEAFSDRFGKHRHQHHRAGTPPGFWRTEMPNTQEIEEDRKDAQKMDREKVEERYREAMRPDGRWTFADE